MRICLVARAGLELVTFRSQSRRFPSTPHMSTCPWMYIPAKKLNARSPRLAVATATAPHTGLYATDEKTSIQYLVDTGACVSIIPVSSAQQQFPDFSLTLTAANGTFFRRTAPPPGQSN